MFFKGFNYARRELKHALLQERIVSEIICKSALIIKLFPQRPRITLFCEPYDNADFILMFFIELQALLTP